MQKLQDLRAALKGQFLERDEEVDGLLVSLLSRQHCFLLGPPGTAKSQMVATLCGCVSGADYFQWLLTKFTTPEEIFGPYSLSHFEQGQYLRIVNGKLPTAHVVFLDEVFKASSAILNTLLTLMQERIFFNDSQPINCPLISLFGAANELPEGEELGALYDRFLLRFEVNYLSEDANFINLLKLSSVPLPTISIEELESYQQEVNNIVVSDSILESILKIRRELSKEGVIASDRRWKQSLDVLKAFAFLENKPEVDEDTLMFLLNVLWSHPGQKKTILKILGAVASPWDARALELYDQAREIYDEVVNAAEDEKEASGIEANKKLKKIVAELAELKDRHPTDKVTTTLEKVQDLQKEVIVKCLGIEI